MADRADYYADANFPTRARYVPVAITADRLAGRERIGREQLDAVALMSQARAAAATPNLDASRVPVTNAQGIALDRDECVRRTTAESLATLEPAFASVGQQYSCALAGEDIEYVHTVAHAPPMTDGVGLALIGAGTASQRARARILSYADAGGDPHASLTAGFTAMERALQRAGLGLQDMDRIEFMEAFAVTIAKFLRDYPVDPQRVNVGGGHLAKGHPLGASGAILVSALLDALVVADGTYGLIVATGGSGVGAAMVVERLR
jgi:acetyl-CoA C-acetyltransferase/acetyl-CoA acyltransferase